MGLKLQICEKRPISMVSDMGGRKGENEANTVGNVRYGARVWPWIDVYRVVGRVWIDSLGYHGSRGVGGAVAGWGNSIG